MLSISHLLHRISLFHLFILAAVFFGYLNIRVAEGDTLMHIRFGQFFIEKGYIPLTDQFSYTIFGKHWAPHEWLSETVMYTLFKHFQFAGLNLFSTLIGMSPLLFVSRWYKKNGRSFSWFVLNAAFLYLFIAAYLVPRPHLVTFLFVAQYLYLMLNLRISTKYLWTMPLSMLIWTNAHGGYMFGLVLMGISLVSEYLSYWMGEDGCLTKSTVVHFAAIFGVTLLCSVIKPGGPNDFLLSFQLSGMPVAQQINEWTSFNYYDPIGKIYLCFVLMNITFLFYNRFYIRFPQLILTLFFIAIGFTAIRHMSLAVLGLVLLNAMCNIDKAKLAEALEKKIPSVYRKLFDSGEIEEKKSSKINILIAMLFIGLIIHTYLHYEKRAQAKLEAIFPEANAVSFIEAHQLYGKLFHSQSIGGYLIYRLYPRQLVFVDGRVDSYGNDFVRDYLEVMSLGSNWRKLFAQYDADIVLIEHQAVLAQMLSVEGQYKIVYDDKHYTVFVKNIPKYNQLIAI